MTGIFNPKDPAAVTVRPAHEVVNPDTDRWYRDCTSPEADDGTLWNAQDANMLLAQLRTATRGMGVPDDPSADDLLLKAIQAAITDVAVLARNMPVWPVALTVDSKLSVTAGSGQVVLDAGQAVVFRGLINVSTDAWTLGERTLATSANKLYHLRLSLAGGPQLKDLADSGYNPSALAETNAAFDSGYDDMLVARISTDGSNVATVTGLKNADVLSHRYAADAPVANAVTTPGTLTGTAQTLDWARTPRIYDPKMTGLNTGSGAFSVGYVSAGYGTFGTFAFLAPAVTRYGSPNLQFYYDDTSDNDGRVAWVQDFLAP